MNIKIHFLAVLLIVLPALGFNLVTAQTDKFHDTYKVVAYKQNANKIISESNTVQASKKIKVYIPNAFSPDGDGINDRFNIVADAIEDYRLEVYDRWGELVFTSFDIKDQWDGYFKGKLAATDAYVYVVHVTGANGENPSMYKGTVSLLK